MLIEFPIEFIVKGTPVSLQAKRSASREEWKARVKEASRKCLPKAHFATEDQISVAIYYFPAEPMQGDLDNIVKPILDALSKHIYMDDAQVEKIVVQKFEPQSVYTFRSLTDVLSEALNEERPVVYIRISNLPQEEST